MNKKNLRGVSAGTVLLLGLITTANATLLERLGGLAYYDDVLDITWAAHANINGFDNWANQNIWASNLTLGGITGWRLPGVSPIDGTSFDINFSNNATTDLGYADSLGWVDGSGAPVSEMGHLYYVTLGNLGFCTPNGGAPAGCDPQLDWGLANTGPFSNVQSGFYWSGTELNSSNAWDFGFGSGLQSTRNKPINFLFAWAVHSGDVGATTVPEPGTMLLMGAGLLGLLRFSKKRRL